MVRQGISPFSCRRNSLIFNLKRLLGAGFGDRIMFGSDVGLDQYEEGIQAILDAEFLTEGQKRDIPQANAARFLKMDLKE